MQCGPRPRVRIKAFDGQEGALLASLEVPDRHLADARDPADPHLPDHLCVGRDKKARHALITARLLTVEVARNARLEYENVAMN